jgi:hypothetical protein
MAYMTAEQQAFATFCEQFKEPARSKMLALIPRIDGHEHSTFKSLAGSASPDQQTRIGRAFKEGLFIRRPDNTFGWPDPRAAGASVPDTDTAARVGAMTRDYYLLPEGAAQYQLMRLHNISTWSAEVLEAMYQESLHEFEAPTAEQKPKKPPSMSTGCSEYINFDEQGDETVAQTQKRLAKKKKLDFPDPSDQGVF